MLQDAMTVTHLLGLRYIWIDALAIIQDDADDWRVVATKMCTIYGNAFITIAAMDATDCGQGILAWASGIRHYVFVWPLAHG